MGSVHGFTGVNWKVEPDGGGVTIFGVRVLPKDTKSIYVDMGLLMPVTVVDRVKAVLEDIIRADREEGKEAEIAEVRVPPLDGARLYLEGVITLAMLKSAQETPSTITVIVELGGKTRKLVIVNTDDDTITGTYNAAGEMV